MAFFLSFFRRENMTVQSKISKAVYEADGVTTAFMIPFYFFEHQVAVYRGIGSTPLTEGTDYTLEGSGNPEGGAVIFGTAPDAGEVITIMRHVDLTQLITFMEGEKFPAADYEHGLDKITMALQELSAYLDNCITIPAGANFSSDDLFELLVTINNHLADILSVPEVATQVTEIYTQMQTVLNQYYTKAEVDAMQPIKVTDIEALCADVVSDETYAEYPYKLDIAVTGANAQKLPQVILSAEDAGSGIFAPIALSYDGGVRLYLKEIPQAQTIQIPAILLH
jgi:hypothetical protein